MGDVGVTTGSTVKEMTRVDSISERGVAGDEIRRGKKSINVHLNVCVCICVCVCFSLAIPAALSQSIYSCGEENVCKWGVGI